MVTDMIEWDISFYLFFDRKIMHDSKGCKDKLPEQVMSVKQIGFHGDVNKITQKRWFSF